MPTFPTLASRAVAQYPTSFGLGQAVQRIRFIDGSDQRFLVQGRNFRRWKIDLADLTDDELQALGEFFLEVNGSYSTFDFPDPLTGSIIPNCRLGDAQLLIDFRGLNTGSTSLWVLETND